MQKWLRWGRALERGTRPTETPVTSFSVACEMGEDKRQ